MSEHEFVAARVRHHLSETTQYIEHFIGHATREMAPQERILALQSLMQVAEEFAGQAERWRLNVGVMDTEGCPLPSPVTYDEDGIRKLLDFGGNDDIPQELP